jgi:hypothetical protein
MFLAILFLLMSRTVIASDTTTVEHWPPASSDHATVQDLHREYNNIFLHGNRNAASHRWATFLLDRSHQMSESSLTLFFSGFCAVSGSPVRPSDYNRYRLTLPKLGGGHSTGYMHYCCWPCVCDTQDFIRVDTKKVKLANNVEQTFQFAVIGNPCDNPNQLKVPFVQPFDRRQTSIAESAREVRCLDDNGMLEGATLSDHGYIIISMFFDSEDAEQGVDGIVRVPGAMEDIPDPTPGRMSSGKRLFQDEREYKLQCEDRAKNGYNSGMGEIFRKVCAVSPISEEALQLRVPAGSEDGIAEDMNLDDCKGPADVCNEGASNHNKSETLSADMRNAYSSEL